MPWLEDLKFPRGYQMGTHKKQFDLFKQTKEKMLNQIHNGYELCEIL